jgi:hypothetical protein
MATYTKKTLSASTDGRAVLVLATGSTGTTIHTGPSTSTTIHELWLYASNPDTSARVLTIQWGGTTSPDDSIVVTLPAYAGLIVVSPGLLIKGNATPLVVRAFADVASKVTVTGYVNEIA